MLILEAFCQGKVNLIKTKNLYLNVEPVLLDPVILDRKFFFMRLDGVKIFSLPFFNVDHKPVLSFLPIYFNV